MYGTVRATQWGYSLWELEVYGTGGPTNTPGPSPTSTNTVVGPTNTPTRTNTPVPTATRTPTPCGSCGGPLPKHVITGYWQNFNNGALVLRLSNVPTAYNLIAVAFADATGSPGAVTFNIDAGLSSALGGYTNANFTSDIATVHGQGRKVIISVGGQNGTISVSDSTSANNFANSIVGLMNTFGFDGVDIDLENGINVTYMTNALNQIASQKPGAIITMAPQTIDMQSQGNAYFQVALNIRSVLTIVNMQYYNSGSMLGCDQMNPYSQATENFLTALACIQLQSALRPDQIGLGLPASISAAGGGYVAPSVVNAALDCLAAGTNCGTFHPPSTWPGIRGAMTWSINWDGSNGYNWVNTINAHLPSVP
jgi:chitinase